MKKVALFGVFVIAVYLGWAIHPVLGVVIAVIGYGVIDGVLTK